MIDLLQRLRDTKVESGTIAVCSLGQAGYAYKRSNGQYVLIDPYLTDSCSRRVGPSFKRLTPSLIDPEELDLITHHHEDHLDDECVRRMKSTDFPFYAPPETIRQLQEYGISPDRCFPLSDGRQYEIDGMIIRGIFADHGESAPDAVGILVNDGGKCIYHTGDTCLIEPELRGLAAVFSVDLMFVPINAKYGNMNEQEAAKAISIVKPKRAVPCHFWLLPGNSGGDPLLFLEESEKQSPDTVAGLLAQGEIIVV